MDELIARGDHDGLCEWCDAPGLTTATVVEGRLGWYCSDACHDTAEHGDCCESDDASRATERRQMGFVA